MFNKLRDKWIDKTFFKRSIEENFGLDKSTLKELKDSADKFIWQRLYEKTKLYIATTSLMSNTTEGIQRRNNWIECLNYLQSILEDKNKKESQIDFRTMQKK